MKTAHRRPALLSCAFLISILTCMHVSTAASAEAEKAADYRNPDELLGLLSTQAEPYLLVDVRTKAEYAAGHIPTAINVPYDVIAQQPPTADKSALIIVYCVSGRRSAIAASALTRLGYTRVVDFGGISRWKWELEVV